MILNNFLIRLPNFCVKLVYFKENNKLLEYNIWSCKLTLEEQRLRS